MKISIRTILITVFLVVTMSISALAANTYTEYDVANTQSLPICGLYQVQYTVGEHDIQQHSDWYVAVVPDDGNNLLFTSSALDITYILYPTDNPLIWSFYPFSGDYSYTNYMSFSQDGTQLVWQREEEGTSYCKKIA